MEDPDRLVRIGNLTTIPEISRHLGVHWNTIYLWRNNRERTAFPEPLRRVGQHEIYDYGDVFFWFQNWAATHPGVYKFVEEALA